MKKIWMMLFGMALLTSAEAQYKKASFFTRNGKFLGVKAGVDLFGNGVSATPSIAYIYGKDQGKNRIWHWWDLEYTAGSNFSYTSTDNNLPAAGSYIHISGKVSGMFTWRYNWAVYLTDNKNEDVKGLPFAKIGLEWMLGGRRLLSERQTPSNASPTKSTYSGGGNFGADIGAGYVYKISESSTLFGVAGYRLVLVNENNFPNEFITAPSHPFVNIGIRFSKGNND